MSVNEAEKIHLTIIIYVLYINSILDVIHLCVLMKRSDLSLDLIRNLSALKMSLIQFNQQKKKGGVLIIHGGNSLHDAARGRKSYQPRLNPFVFTTGHARRRI